MGQVVTPNPYQHDLMQVSTVWYHHQPITCGPGPDVILLPDPPVNFAYARPAVSRKACRNGLLLLVRDTSSLISPAANHATARRGQGSVVDATAHGRFVAWDGCKALKLSSWPIQPAPLCLRLESSNSSPQRSHTKCFDNTLTNGGRHRSNLGILPENP